MNKELLLKTVFACMACDGDIAEEEIGLVKQITVETNLFEGFEVEKLLNTYISQINRNGKMFLNKYLSDVAGSDLTEDEQLTLIDLAFKTIEADHVIEYSEVKFFKKIRSRLSVNDETILMKFPEEEEFLLPDNNVTEEPDWDNVVFFEIKLKGEENVSR